MLKKGEWIKKLANVVCFTLVCFMLLYCHVSAEEIIQKESQAGCVDDEDVPVKMEYYQYNVCASCHPEDDFFDITYETIRPMKDEYPYEITVYNTFRSDDKKRLKESLQKLGISKEVNLPVLIVGSTCLSGLDEIKSGICKALEDEARNIPPIYEDKNKETYAIDENEVNTGWRKKLEIVMENDSSEEAVVLYFSTMSCDDCKLVKEFFSKLDESGEYQRLRIHELNITQEDNVVILQKLFELYETKTEQQQVPIVFFKGGYLSGADAVKELLEEKYKAGELDSFTFADIEKMSENTDNTEKKSWGTYLTLTLTGFVNGINPCGASMLLMLLAAIAMSGKSVIKTGCAYLAGKFAAYCAMGLGFYKLFMAASQDIFLTVSNVLTWVFAGIFLVLAVLYIIDFIHVRKKEYGKIRMQLPQALRKWNREKIEKASKTNGYMLIPAVIVLGIVISAGEFFCTGQVYLASILYMMKMQKEHQMQTMLAFFIYVTALCIPSLLMVFVIEKTRNVIRMSNAAVTWLPFIKLATAIVFLLFAIFMIIM